MTQTCPKCNRRTEYLLIALRGENMCEIQCLFCILDSERTLLKHIQSVKKGGKKERK